MSGEVEVRYVAYNDTWLKETLRTMRDDLTQHREDDRIAHGELRKAMEDFRQDLHELKQVLSVLTAAGRGIQWLIMLVAGAGGLAFISKMVLGWLGKS